MDTTTKKASHRVPAASLAHKAVNRNVHKKSEIPALPKLTRGQTALLLWFVFFVYTLLIRFVDVQAIGPQDSSVGFAALNGAVLNAIPYNIVWYKISDVLGNLALLVIVLFGLIGGLQLFVRRKLLAVDPELLILGVFYMLVLCCYVFFEIVIINYRPVILEEELEASYPSSHTVLAICVLYTAIFQYPFYFKDLSLLFASRAVSILMMATIVLSRFLSGVHWFTDIIGGILLSAALCSTYHILFIYGKRILRQLRKKYLASAAAEPAGEGGTGNA